MKQDHKVIYYVPEKLVYEKLVGGRSSEIKKINLYRIIDFIVKKLNEKLQTLPSKYKDSHEKPKFFVDIPAISFKKIDRDYKKYLDFLVSNGVLIQSPYDYKKGKCRSYKFSDNYYSKIVPHTFYHKGFKKKQTENSYRVNQDTPYLRKLHKDTNNITIDSCVEQNLKKNKEKMSDAEYNARYRPYRNIVDKNIYFIRDDSVNRVHTTFTNMPRDIRKHVYVNGYKMNCEMDIKNCVYTHLAILLINKSKQKEYGVYDYLNSIEYTEETKEFIKICLKGRLKSEIMKLIELDYEANRLNWDVDTVKENLIIYLGAICGYKFIQRVIKKVLSIKYPQVVEIIDGLKRILHKDLSRILMQAEAYFMIDHVLPAIQNKLNIPVLTVHDCIVIPEQYKEEVKQIFIEESNKVYGLTIPFGMSLLK